MEVSRGMNLKTKICHPLHEAEQIAISKQIFPTGGAAICPRSGSKWRKSPPLGKHLDFPLEKPRVSSEYGRTTQNAMTRLSLILTLLISILVSPAIAEQYQHIKPELKCHYPRKDVKFTKIFPNFSFRHGLLNPEPEMLGNIEWCREDITVTERSECGEFETYEAVVITYRPVYENGAWGKKFRKTYRKNPKLSGPLLAKGVAK